MKVVKEVKPGFGNAKRNANVASRAREVCNKLHDVGNAVYPRLEMLEHENKKLRDENMMLGKALAGILDVYIDMTVEEEDDTDNGKDNS